MIGALSDWLNSPALMLWATSLSVAECLGFLTGIVCVWLAARNHMGNFPAGIANADGCDVSVFRHGLVIGKFYFATGVWHERYVARRCSVVEALAKQGRARLGYILCDWPDVPFEQDGLRDGEHLRAWMHERFVARLTEERATWLVVTGSPQARVVQSLAWIDRTLAGAWQFADPVVTGAAPG